MGEHPEDMAMDAECRVLGTLMLLGAEAARTSACRMIPYGGFQCDFHAQVFVEALRLATRGVLPDPVLLWEAVQAHPQADDFGLQHLAELVGEAASPETFTRDCAELISWAALNEMAAAQETFH